MNMQNGWIAGLLHGDILAAVGGRKRIIHDTSGHHYCFWVVCFFSLFLRALAGKNQAGWLTCTQNWKNDKGSSKEILSGVFVSYCLNRKAYFGLMVASNKNVTL
jgi:hypothetical protein